MRTLRAGHPSPAPTPIAFCRRVSDASLSRSRRRWNGWPQLSNVGLRSTAAAGGRTATAARPSPRRRRRGRRRDRRDRNQPEIAGPGASARRSPRCRQRRRSGRPASRQARAPPAGGGGTCDPPPLEWQGSPTQSRHEDHRRDRQPGRRSEGNRDRGRDMGASRPSTASRTMRMEQAASANPSIRLPESPMNTRAGGRLCQETRRTPPRSRGRSRRRAVSILPNTTSPGQREPADTPRAATRGRRRCRRGSWHWSRLGRTQRRRRSPRGGGAAGARPRPPLRTPPPTTTSTRRRPRADTEATSSARPSATIATIPAAAHPGRRGHLDRKLRPRRRP